MFEPRGSVADRYNFSPSPHLPVMKISEHIGKSKKVLDVGCSTGYLAKQLKQKGCFVVGIEIDEAAAEAAKQHCESVLVGDVEQMVSCPIRMDILTQ